MTGGQDNEAGRGRPGDPDFDARRMTARQRLDELTGAIGGDPEARQDWFNAVYQHAAGDPAGVPWARLEPHELLRDWLAGGKPGGVVASGLRALDVGCGLGDNAEALAAAGLDVTAFDLSETAVHWAQSRFPTSSVTYLAGDLFAPPLDWMQGFDLVHECYTLQALNGAERAEAASRIAAFVAPAGHLLVVTRSNLTGQPADGPPWPLVEDEVTALTDHGLTLVDLEHHTVTRDRDIPHIRALFRRG